MCNMRLGSSMRLVSSTLRCAFHGRGRRAYKNLPVRVLVDRLKAVTATLVVVVARAVRRGR
jgi:hypothetical protein